MKITEAFQTKKNKLWFMSDLHYNHENVIKFNRRPFENVKEMNWHIEQELITKVGPGDILFDMGDLFWKTDETTMKNVISLASPKEWYKILGNHDNYNVYRKSYIGTLFTLLSDILEINVDHEGRNYRLTLCHYPMISWNGKARGTLMIHGHCHGNIDNINTESTDLRVDVGFDGAVAKKTGSFLISFEDILEYMKEKTGGSLDFMKHAQERCNAL